MTSNRIIILLFMFLLSGTTLKAQQNDVRDYLIVTYALSINKLPQHGVQEFTWIVPIDSVSRFNVKLSPLLIDAVPDNLINDCRNGKIIDPFILTNADTFDYDSSYLASLEVLKKTIERNRVKVQEINKTWDADYKEKTIVYLSFVSGKFCNCMLNKRERKFQYEGELFIPEYSSFSPVMQLLDTQKLKFLRHFDYMPSRYVFRYY